MYVLVFNMILEYAFKLKKYYVSFICIQRNKHVDLEHFQQNVDAIQM